MVFSQKIVFGKKATQECPCGYLGDPSGRCHCTVEQVHRYRARLSGPLLDRIDIHVDVPRIPIEVLRKSNLRGEESSARIQARVVNARNRALARSGQPNAVITPAQIKTFCRLSASGDQLLEQAMNQLGLSHRAYHRILKLARTIADLAEAEDINVSHLSEAIAYRKLDRTA